jgi:subtilisin family serine protease
MGADRRSGLDRTIVNFPEEIVNGQGNPEGTAGGEDARGTYGLEGTAEGQDGQSVLAERIAAEQVGRISAEFWRQGVAVESEHAPDGGVYLYAADQLLVKEQYLARVRDALGESVSIEEPHGVIDGVTLLRFRAKGLYEPRPTVREVLTRLERAGLREAASPDYVLTVAPETGPCPATEPQEVYFEIEPSPGVRMDEGSDGRAVRIYIADTGLLSDTQSHWWLKGVRGMRDPLDPVPWELIKPYAGHGTFVAGVARCMARHARVFVSNVFKVAGSALESDFVADLYKALNDGAQIFNLSVTTRAKGELRLLGFEAWLTFLSERRPDAVCVVAAGNDSSSEKFWPAAYAEKHSNIVSVGALAADWRSRASFSNHGPWVKVYAPGRDLVNAYATGIYECKDAPYTGQRREFFGMAKWSGTSFSTPIVTGLIAARMSATEETAQEAANFLLAAARAQAIPGVRARLLPYGNNFDI